MLFRFTKKNILRVYPKGERVKSSNFKPHLGWMYGAQMVAFNMQVRKLRPIHKQSVSNFGIFAWIVGNILKNKFNLSLMYCGAILYSS